MDPFDPEVHVKYLDPDLRVGECDIVAISIAGSFPRNMEFDVRLATDRGLAFDRSCSVRTRTWRGLTGRTRYYRNFPVYGCANNRGTGTLSATLIHHRLYVASGQDTANIIPPPTPTPTHTPTPTPTPTPRPTPTPTPTYTPIPISKPALVPPPPPDPTSTPTPTPTPQFNVKVQTSSKQLLRYAQWSVLHTEYVQLEVDVNGGGLVPASYEFKLDVAPNNTGFQIATNAGVCDWNRPPDSNTWASSWDSPASNIAKYSHSVHLVRCGLGTKAGEMRVIARNGATGTPFTILTLPVKQAWHRVDNDVTYYIKGTKSGETLFPVNASHTPNPVLSNHSNYEMAARIWNDVKANVTITKVSNPDLADVIIIGYWDPYLTTNPKENDGVCGTSIACIVNSRAYFPNISNLINYPYLGYQTFYIEERPRWGLYAPLDWTDNFSEADMYRDKYIYLPTVLAHEFGHTIGLGHSTSVSWDVMNSPDRKLEPCSKGDKSCGLSENDKNAVKALYQP